jgi:hypothetical protein
MQELEREGDHALVLRLYAWNVSLLQCHSLAKYIAHNVRVHTSQNESGADRVNLENRADSRARW